MVGGWVISEGDGLNGCHETTARGLTQLESTAVLGVEHSIVR